MGVRWDKVFWLGTKELRGLRADPVLLFLIAFGFGVGVYNMATGVKKEVENAPVGIVDEDDSELSRRIGLAVLEPYFKPAVEIRADEIDSSMDSARKTLRPCVMAKRRGRCTLFERAQASYSGIDYVRRRRRRSLECPCRATTSSL